MPSPRKRSRRSNSVLRTKTGCYTCRIRRKKCDENINEDGQCETCVRLRLECLGFGARRPEWLREPCKVDEMRERIKQFLSSQGMVQGGPGSSSRSPEQDLPMLNLSEGLSEHTSPETPATPMMLLPEEVDPVVAAAEASLESYYHAIELYPGQSLFSNPSSPLAPMFDDELSMFVPDLLSLPYF